MRRGGEPPSGAKSKIAAGVTHPQASDLSAQDARSAADHDLRPAFVDLPRGLFVNAFELSAPAVYSLRRYARPDSRDARQRLERRIGHPLKESGDFVYAIDGHGEAIDFDPAGDPELHAFVVREALLAHAAGRGYDARVVFGEVRIHGLPGELSAHGLRAQRGVRLRVAAGVAVGRDLLFARHDMRWLFAGSLLDAKVRAAAPGAKAVRLEGDGPGRAEVNRLDGDEVVLRIRRGSVRAPAAHYTLAAQPGLVRRHLGAAALRWQQLSSGSLTESGRRNRYAVKDRMGALAEDLGSFGLSLEFPRGGTLTISPQPVAIRISERS